MDSGVLLHPGQGPFTKHLCSALPESPPHPAFLIAELQMVAQDGRISPSVVQSCSLNSASLEPFWRKGFSVARVTIRTLGFSNVA